MSVINHRGSAKASSSAVGHERHTRHVPALDGLRGLAILMVMAHNFNLLDDTEGPVATATDLVLNFGWVGVQLFFVLSGFLITSILLTTKTSANYFRSFFGRRAVRIFPLYYLSLAAGFILYPLISGKTLAGAENQVWLWTYLSNWAAPLGHGVGLYPHMWSLAVEEQFYLIWPVAVFLLTRRGLTRFCVGLAVLALASRISIRVLDLPSEAAYQFTICRIDAIALGALAAIAFRNANLLEKFSEARSLIRWLLAAATLLTFILTKGAPRAGLLTQTLGYTAFAMIGAVLILDIADGSTKESDGLSRVLCWPVLRRMGTYSYAAYVFHKPLHQLVGLPLVTAMHSGQRASVGVALLYFVVLSVCVFFVSHLSFHLFEKHFLKLKRYFTASG